MTKKLKKSAKPSFEYYALQYRQRGSHGPEFMIFHAPASEIKAWADVDRMSDSNPSGAQRPLRELKARKIARFFDDPRNTIPTAVIVALDQAAVSFRGRNDRPGSTTKNGLLRVTPKAGKNPGLIIDGQHRVYGAADAASPVQLTVVALIGADDPERAFQFVVINNSANRVSSDHIKALNLSYNPDLLNKRLMASANMGLQEETYQNLQIVDTGEQSPFRHQLKWARNANGFVVSSAIETAIKETTSRRDLLGIADLEIDFFLLMWEIVKKKWPELWNEHTHLLEKVSIQALTVFILDNLVAVRNMSDTPKDFTKDATAREFIAKSIDKIPADFWEVEWSKTELDTRLGHEILLRTLRLVTANVLNNFAWYQGLEIVSPSAVKVGSSGKGKKHKTEKTKK